PLESAPQYSLVYGPFTYIWAAAHYGALGPSIFAAKLTGCVSSLASLAILLAALKRDGNWRVALPCVALAATIYVSFGVQSFWCRPDGHDCFLVALSIFALTLANPWIAAILIGISAGVGVNLKLTAAAYFLPIGTAFILRYRRPGAAGFALALAIATAAGPFLLPEISLTNYFAWLQSVESHPLSWGELLDSLQCAGWMLGILLVLGMAPIASTPRGEASAIRQWCWTAAALVAAIALTLPIAGKQGAGRHHLIPLTPMLVWLVARSWSMAPAGESPPRWRLRHWLIVPVLIVALIFSADACFSITNYIRQGEPTNRAIVADLGLIMDELPGRTIEMGVGGNRTYPVTFARPVLVFAGNPYHLDPASAMDVAKARQSLPAATADLCRSGLADFVLIPKGDAPFSLRSGFTPHPAVFSAEFVGAFRDHYQLRFRSAYFDIYGRYTIPRSTTWH
ncbi:MAG: hypothetical protein ABSF29_13920, partial [Tepidisphaeraceae bacterium]